MALEYVLITPARNEAEFIELTLRSVVAQTVLPKRWVIVSDGSTDGTDELVEKYQKGRPWLELVRLPERKERDFAAKVNAFEVGYGRVKNLDFDIVGNVDADVSFAADYFEYILTQFEGNKCLGVAGTHYIEGNFHSYKDSYINVYHVNGQVQMFRRSCYEDIGGYVPIKGGGIDWVAVTTARMRGWETYSFGERIFNHHRKMGTAGGSEIKARFHYGKKDYFLGGHPLWQLFRSAFQLTKKPYVVGGLALMSGYMWYWVSGQERAVSPQLMAFHRQEQMTRLRGLVSGRLGFRRHRSSARAQGPNL
ncbi:glycosyltransferase [Thioalkalicoccus limnaeus]|uniref:Glycosyltransferase n=1 Tax=Thioalkalicoccus limnaeus TaxID=120681 RepID=A0ABV4BL42_9GAMM